MKLPLLLIAALLSLSPVVAQAQTSAYGVSFDAPDGWNIATETNPAWTKFRLHQDRSLPKVMIQIYSGHVTPISALNTYVTAHRTKFRDNRWQFSESPTSELFGQQVHNGRQIFYSANGSNYCQRFFAFKVKDRTVLIMSLARVKNDWNYWGYNNQDVPDVLGPFAASLN